MEDRTRRNTTRIRIAALALAFAIGAPAAQAGRLEGVVRDATGPVVGAMVSFSSGDPIHAVTVYSDESGRFATPELSADTPVTLQVDGEAISQRIDQRVAPSDDLSAGAGWHQLGAGTTATATELTVRLTVPEGGDVRADAVRVTAEWGH